MDSPLTPPVAMTIAGSDSGGGAGIQADLKTFAFHRVHGTSALTCVTAQNTCGVERVDPLPAAAVTAQIDAVMDDMTVQSVKLGMLLNAEIMTAVADVLEQSALNAVVVDPVMVTRTGATLIDNVAIATLKERLLPLARVVTPNRYEAQILSNLSIETLADMERAAQKIQALGPQAVLVKGGSMPEPIRGRDVWFDGQQLLTLATKTINTPHTHGTGCTLSAAIAANLASGHGTLTAVRHAKDYITQALNYGLAIGHGPGPVGHFYPLLLGGFHTDDQSGQRSSSGP